MQKWRVDPPWSSSILWQSEQREARETDGGGSYLLFTLYSKEARTLNVSKIKPKLLSSGSRVKTNQINTCHNVVLVIESAARCSSTAKLIERYSYEINTVAAKWKLHITLWTVTIICRGDSFEHNPMIARTPAANTHHKSRCAVMLKHKLKLYWSFPNYVHPGDNRGGAPPDTNVCNLMNVLSK